MRARGQICVIEISNFNNTESWLRIQIHKPGIRLRIHFFLARFREFTPHLTTLGLLPVKTLHSEIKLSSRTYEIISSLKFDLPFLQTHFDLRS